MRQKERISEQQIIKSIQWLTIGILLIILSQVVKEREVLRQEVTNHTIQFTDYDKKDYEHLSDEEKVEIFITEIVEKELEKKEIEELARVLYWDHIYEYKIIYVMGINWIYGEEEAIDLIDEIYLDPDERFNMKLAMYRYNRDGLSED